MMMPWLDVHAERTSLSLFDPNNVEMQTVTSHNLPGTSVPKQVLVDASD